MFTSVKNCQASSYFFLFLIILMTFQFIQQQQVYPCSFQSSGFNMYPNQILNLTCSMEGQFTTSGVLYFDVNVANNDIFSSLSVSYFIDGVQSGQVYSCNDFDSCSATISGIVSSQSVILQIQYFNSFFYDGSIYYQVSFETGYSAPLSTLGGIIAAVVVFVLICCCCFVFIVVAITIAALGGCTVIVTTLSPCLVSLGCAGCLGLTTGVTAGVAAGGIGAAGVAAGVAAGSIGAAGVAADIAANQASNV